jgi:hypothetical protein
MADKSKKKTSFKEVAKLVTSILKKEKKTSIEKPKKKVQEKKSVLKKVTPKKPEVLKDIIKVEYPKNGAKETKSPVQVSNKKKIVSTDREIVKIKSFFPNISSDGPRYTFKSEIPENYNDTYMRAIPRDPQWLFVYWEISESTRNEIRTSVGDALFVTAKRILRLVDISDISYDGKNAQNFIDIEINEFANNWYIQVPQAGRTYLVEYGILTVDGRTYLPIRSNSLSIPREGVSPVRDEEWFTVATPELIRVSSESFDKVNTLGSSQNRIHLQSDQFSLSYASGSGIGMVKEAIGV